MTRRTSSVVSTTGRVPFLWARRALMPASSTAMPRTFAVEKQQGVKDLILRRAGHLAGHGEMGQKRLDLRGPHLLGVAFVVEQDIASHPVEVGAFGTNRVVFAPDDVPSPLE